MKGLIVLVFFVLVLSVVWSASNCNNKIPFLQGYIGNNYCMCPSPMMKVNGVNGSSCGTAWNDSLTPCVNYDQCIAPEQCVRINQSSFACRYVQGGCYDYMVVGQMVKSICK